MTSNMFALLCFVSFALPIPLLVWLDRPRKKQGQG